MNELALVELKQGKLSTTSLLVAEKFGKEHYNVLRSIETLMASQPDFTALNFEVSEYLDNSGKSNKVYIMTEEGFAMIAMRFTGKAAEDWQIKFITAFQTLRTQLATPALNTDKQATQISQWEAHCARFNLPSRTLQEGLLRIQGLSPTLLGKPPKEPALPKPPKAPKGANFTWKWLKPLDAFAYRLEAEERNRLLLLGKDLAQRDRAVMEEWFQHGYLTKVY